MKKKWGSSYQNSSPLKADNGELNHDGKPRKTQKVTCFHRNIVLQCIRFSQGYSSPSSYSKIHGTLRPVKARLPVYYSTKMDKHTDTNVRRKQQNTVPQVHIHKVIKTSVAMVTPFT